jgi:Protein of unknown function (DUF3433)
LRHRNTPAKRSICINHLGKLPIFAPLSVLANHHIGAALVSLAAILRSFLTVVVSRLFVIDAVPRPQAAIYACSDDFKLNWNSSSNDYLAGTMLTLLGYQNASYPLLTHEDLALPNPSFSGYQASDRAAQLVPGSGSVTLCLNALRGSLNCSLVPTDDITILHGPTIDLGCGYSTNPTPWPVRVWSSLRLPPECHSSSIDSSYLHSYQSNSSIQLNASFSLGTNVTRNITHPPLNKCANVSSPSTDWESTVAA